MSNPYQQQQPPDPYGSYGQQQPAYHAPQYQQPGHQQPGYPPPGYGYPPPAAEPNSLATAALAVGFASIVICFYGALVGPIGLGLGIVGLNRARVSGVGRTQAIGGLVLSVLGILIGVAGLVFYATVSDDYAA
ncbi:hypothetical protein ACIRPK_12615 [Kitasatospora sp. NPDC101801]|uniref:hypothetical protein n=1 Tax=Kitasatospora sp. NPDC101801 TaxID=3364103 RepID=UPI0037F566CB